MPKLKDNPVEQKIYCHSCLVKEISFETSEENNGICDECKKDLEGGRIIQY